MVPLAKSVCGDDAVHTVDGDEVLARESRQRCSETLPFQFRVCESRYENISILPELVRQSFRPSVVQYAMKTSLVSILAVRVLDKPRRGPDCAFDRDREALAWLV